MAARIFPPPRAGFTLVQVLVAIVVVSIALIPASSVFTASTRNVQRGDLRLAAAMAAQSLIDDLRLRRDVFEITEERVLLPSPLLPGLDIPAVLLPVIDRSAEVRLKRDPHFPDLAREVTVAVRYDEYGVERETLLSTLVTDTRERHHRRMP